MQEQLDERVLTPIDQWLRTFEKLQEEYKQLEVLRVEVDSRRRTVTDLEAKLTKKTEQLQGITEGAARARQEEAAAKLKVQKEHKQSKLETALSEFSHQEQLLHAQLTELIQDISFLPDHIGGAFRILQSAFQQQGDAIGTSDHPDTGPGLPTAAPTDAPELQHQPAGIPAYPVPAFEDRIPHGDTPYSPTAPYAPPAFYAGMPPAAQPYTDGGPRYG